MTYAVELANTQLTAANVQAGRIAFAARLGCARAMLAIGAHANQKDLHTALEHAACLPPLDNIPAAKLRQEAARNADAILGCGSPKVVAAFSALLAPGAERATLPSLHIESLAGHITPDVADAASLYTPKSLIEPLFWATCGLVTWSEFWKRRIPELAQGWLDSRFWLLPGFVKLPGLKSEASTAGYPAAARFGFSRA